MTAAASQPDGITLYTVVLLKHAGRYLLLRRADTKPFAPGRWTGIGGKVEPDELGHLQAAALRELDEETGIRLHDVQHFALRRVLLHTRDDSTLTILLYFTGELAQTILPPCSEGTLAWVTPEGLPALDVIDSTRPVLPLLIDDLARDPLGREHVRLGVSRQCAGTIVQLAWV